MCTSIYASSRRPDFEELCKIEPRLAVLLEEAKSITDDPAKPIFCANALWYKRGGLKDRLQSLVGYEAENQRLRTSEAYDTAYDAICSTLPLCRNCQCL